MKRKALVRISTVAVMPIVLGGLFLTGGCVQEDTPMPPGVYVPKSVPAPEPTTKAPTAMEPQAVTEVPAEQPLSAPVAEPQSAPTAQKGITYKVVRGDSLWSLSKKYNVSMEAIAESNGLTPKSKLRIGQTLTIPAGADAVSAAKKSSAKSAKSVKSTKAAKSKTAAKVSAKKSVAKESVPANGVYVVKSGDSFAKIAKRYGMKVSELEAANPGVSSNRLQIGQKLNLKAGAVAAAPVAAAAPATEKKAAAPAQPMEVSDDSELAPPPDNNASGAAPAPAAAAPAASAPAADVPAVPAGDMADDKTQELSNGMEVTLSEDSTVKDVITRYAVSEEKFKALNPGLTGSTLKRGTIIRLP